jgi:hypothetical protein
MYLPQWPPDVAAQTPPSCLTMEVAKSRRGKEAPQPTVLLRLIVRQGAFDIDKEKDVDDDNEKH